MREELLYFYERELSYVRRTGAEFAKRYPKIASRLLLEPGKCEDPHVERLLEGFAFLAARVHLKIEDDFPEISEALLNIVYPNYVRPIPSISVAQFEMDPDQGKLTTGFNLPRGTQLHTRGVGGAVCKFQTCYDTMVWPVDVVEAQWSTPDRLKPPVKSQEAVGAIRLELKCFPDVSFEKLTLKALMNQAPLTTLRFFLHGEGTMVATLYELLCNNCIQVLIRDPSPNTRRRPLVLPGSAMTPVGFGEDEGILPYPRRSFLAYRLLQEYFVFPEKFYFFDLAGLDLMRAAGFGAGAEVIFLISAFERGDRRQMLETSLRAETFRVGCTPIVNLFPQLSEPILVSQRRHEYQVVPDARRRETTEIFSIEEVSGATAGGTDPLTLEPLYSYRHGAEAASDQIFWHASRKPSGWRLDGGSDVFLSFADLTGRLRHPEADAITARLTCFNSDLPTRLPFGSEAGDFELPSGGPLKRITALSKPTGVIQPPLGKPQLWRLISHFSLNYVSLLEGGVDALREILRLHNFGDTAAGQKQVQGLKTLKSTPVFSRIMSDHGITFARGHRVEVDLDEEEFTGGSLYLFASVLERFLGLYTSINSFSILVARSMQRKAVVREWAPRAGWKQLI